MMKYYTPKSGRWVVIDIETLGLDPKRYAMVEIAAVTDDGDHWESGPIRIDNPRFQSDALACNAAHQWHPQFAGIDLTKFCDSTRQESAIKEFAEKGAFLPTPRAAVTDLISFCRGRKKSDREQYIIAGRFPQFDIGFLKHAAEYDAPNRLKEDLNSVFCLNENLDIHDLVRWSLIYNRDPVQHLSKNDRYEHIGSRVEPLPHRAMQGAIMEWEQINMCFNIGK